MTVSYSKSFVDFDTSQQFIKNDNTPGPGAEVPSQVSDVTDPNLRHQFISQATPEGASAVYCLKLVASTDQRVNCAVMIDVSHDSFGLDVQNAAGNNLYTWPRDQVAFSSDTNRSRILIADRTYTTVRNLFLCFRMQPETQFSARYCGFCELVRIPRDPNSVKTEHLRLGLRSEFPGQQFHQEGLGTYRRITMSWERLGADDLRVLDEAYHTVPNLEAPVVLYDDSDPQGGGIRAVHWV